MSKRTHTLGKIDEIGQTLPVHGVVRAGTANPLQLRLFDDKPELVPLFFPLEDERELSLLNGDVSVVSSEGLSHVFVSGFGIFIGKKSERLVVRKESKALYEFPLFRISDIVVGSLGTSVSTDLISEACKRGIRLSFLSGGGVPYAMLTSPMLTAVVEQRREQVLAHSDERSVIFAREVAYGKINNQSKLLRYFAKYLKKSDITRFQRLDDIASRLSKLARRARAVSGHSIDDVRGELMGIEGTSGRLYWEAVEVILEESADFEGRHHRNAADVVNAALNYGYGILYTQVWGALMNAGLEPFAGFLHVDRPGKASLVLDLIEEFRQPVVDRAIIAMINLKVPLKMSGNLLDMNSRREVARRVFDQLEATALYRGKEYELRSIIQMQARNLGKFLRRSGKYKPFSFRY